MADDESKDTQVLRKEEAGFLDMEGTEEMDRAALLARLQADSGAGPKEPKVPARESSEVVSVRDTQQQQAISEATLSKGPSEATSPDPTQHYVVPDSLLKRARDTQVETVEVPMGELPGHDHDDDLPTTTFSMESFLEFEAVVDEHGRIALPDSALRGKFKHGARLKVMVHAVEDGE